MSAAPVEISAYPGIERALHEARARFILVADSVAPLGAWTLAQARAAVHD